MRHVVMFSGGVGSWLTARRVAERHGTKDLVLLFADTRMEDEDLYRFLDEAAADVGGELVRIADGRTPWGVFEDVRYLGNSRIDPCSKILKRDFMRRWIEENCDPAETIIYLGIDWTEIHRFEKAAPRWAPYRMEAPLCEPPYLSKEDGFRLLEDRGIRRPRLYEMGFAHNNCGGFCVKAGMGAFANLLEMMPERYAEHEAREAHLQETIGKPVTILRSRAGGKTTPLSLREFRESVQSGCAVDRTDVGGCGCAVE